MCRGYKALLPFLALIMLLSAGLAACGKDTATTGANGSTTPTSPSASNETEYRADVSGNLVAVRNDPDNTDIYNWVMDIKLSSVGDVIGYKNPLTGKENTTITAKIQKYMEGVAIGQGIACTVEQFTSEKGVTFLVASNIR